MYICECVWTYRGDKIWDVYLVSNAECAFLDGARQVHVLHQITDVVGLFEGSGAKRDQTAHLTSGYVLICEQECVWVSVCMYVRMYVCTYDIVYMYYDNGTFMSIS